MDLNLPTAAADYAGAAPYASSLLAEVLSELG